MENNEHGGQRTIEAWTLVLNELALLTPGLLTYFCYKHGDNPAAHKHNCGVGVREFILLIDFIIVATFNGVPANIKRLISCANLSFTPPRVDHAMV